MATRLDAKLRLTVGDADLVRGWVHRDGARVALTTKEREVLEYLAERVGEAVTREALLADVWGYRPDAMTRAADHTVRRLRQKIEVDPAKPVHLLTVHGVGYRLVVARAEPPVSVGGRDADFVGRERELEALERACLKSRLVTVWGPGGAGKTRLVQRWRPSNAVFVDATDARTGAALAELVARAFSARVEDLGAVLAARPRLLVLDNLEQVAGAAAVQIEGWLGAAASLRVVTTSRRRLGVSGETLVSIAGMDPADAARLFVRRGHAAGGVDLEHPDLADAIGRLVASLDHLPLAVELAAARGGVLSVDDLLGRLASGPGLLTTGRGPDRHRSLHRAVTWSIDLLDARHRRALIGLVPFVGGAEMDAIEACLGEGALDRIQHLRDASLVARLPSAPGVVRLGLLASVRQVVEGLAGADLSVVREAHARAFVRLSEGWAHPSTAAMMARRSRARDNLLAAFHWLSSRPDPSGLVQIFSALEPTLRARGPVAAWAACVRDLQRCRPGPDAAAAEARFHLSRGDAQRAEEALSAVDAGEVSACLARARVARAQGRFDEAGEYLEVVLDRRPEGHPDRLRALHQQGLVAYDAGRWEEASVRFAQASAAAEGSEWALARIEVDRAHLELEAGRTWEAHARYTRAADRFASVGDRRSEAIVQSHQALAAQEMGEEAPALGLAEEALEAHRDVGNARFATFAQLLLASLAMDAGRWSEALRGASEARLAFASLGDTPFEAVACARMALAEARLGRSERAVQLAQEAEALGTPGPFEVGVQVLAGAARGERVSVDPAVVARSNLVRIALRQARMPASLLQEDPG